VLAAFLNRPVLDLKVATTTYPRGGYIAGFNPESLAGKNLHGDGGFMLMVRSLVLALCGTRLWLAQGSTVRPTALY